MAAAATSPAVGPKQSAHVSWVARQRRAEDSRAGTAPSGSRDEAKHPAPSLLNVGGCEIQLVGRLLRIARLSLDKYDSVDDPAAMRDALGRCGVRVDLFTFMQTLSETSPKYPYPIEWDNLAALPVSTFDRWWSEQADRRARNHVRVAEKRGIAVREVTFDDSLVRGISAVYDECPVRQGKRFPHHGKDLETVRRENGTFLDRSIFLGAFFGEHLVGFAKLVCDRRGRQAGLMQIISMIRHRDKNPTNALIAQAVRSCAERGIGHLVYSNFSYGKKSRDGLSDFKHHNGFRRIQVPRYYLALTWRGRTMLTLGLHKPLAYRVPEPVLSRVRAARSLWYGRRLRTARR